MRPLVIVRPEPGASRTARAARALGLEPFVMPLFEIVPTPWIAPDEGDFDALLLTSANAVRHAGEKLSRFAHLPVAAVGPATAAAARNEGLVVLAEGDGGVDSLLDALPPDFRLLHLCGRDRMPVSDSARTIDSITVYAAQRLVIDRALLDGNVVVLHSARAARTLAGDLEPPARSAIAVLALSPAVASAAGPGWERIECAATPSDAALLALAVPLCL